LSVGQPAIPTIFQHITHQLFKQLIEKEMCHEGPSEPDSLLNPLTYQEDNALRYMAGYVCRKVHHNINKSSSKDKDDMVELCMQFCGDEEDEDRGSEKWINAIDRGGLWHINDNTFTIFCIIEEEVRRHLRVSSLIELDDTSRRKIMDGLMGNEELLHQWTLLTTDKDQCIAMEVLRKICELYLTVRGFSFAASCLELYKQRSKQQIQKSKALRKKLADKEQNEN